MVRAPSVISEAAKHGCVDARNNRPSATSAAWVAFVQVEGPQHYARVLGAPAHPLRWVRRPEGRSLTRAARRCAHGAPAHLLRWVRAAPRGVRCLGRPGALMEPPLTCAGFAAPPGVLACQGGPALRSTPAHLLRWVRCPEGCSRLGRPRRYAVVASSFCVPPAAAQDGRSALRLTRLGVALLDSRGQRHRPGLGQCRWQSLHWDYLPPYACCGRRGRGSENPVSVQLMGIPHAMQGPDHSTAGCCSPHVPPGALAAQVFRVPAESES